MAVPTGAGTETLHAHHFENIANTFRQVIIGVQHHVYTVLSVICYVSALNAVGNTVAMWISAYDSHAGTTGRDLYVFTHAINEANETFVWNDKFAFNGYEPADQSANLSAAGQIAIAAQASSVPQDLTVVTNHASTTVQVTVTYLDQDWS